MRKDDVADAAGDFFNGVKKIIFGVIKVVLALFIIALIIGFILG